MKPYYEDRLCTIYHGDAKAISEVAGKVACCITDPPYGETSLAWDRWPALWPRWIQSDALWCFGSFRMFTTHWPEFDGWKLAQDVVWEKHNGSGFDTDRFKRVHEFALHFYRGKWGERIHHSPRSKSERKGGTATRRGTPPHRGAIGEALYSYGGTRITRSVIKVKSCHKRATHPTQKPDGIVEPLVLYSTNDGDTVLDPFLGSGTMAAVAKRLGRKFIGGDADEKWCAVAADRLRAIP